MPLTPTEQALKQQMQRDGRDDKFILDTLNELRRQRAVSQQSQQLQQTAQPKAQVDNSTLSPADRRFQKEARKRGFLDRAKERGADVMESVEMAREGKQTTAEAGLQIIGKGIGQTIDTGISAITGLGKALLPKKAEEGLATAAKTVNPFSFPGRLRDVTSGQPIGTTNQNLMGAVGEGFQKYEEFSKENPRLSKNLEAGMEIGSVVVPQSRLGKEVTKEALAATKALATSQVGRAAAQVAAAPVKVVGAGYRGAKEVGKFATAKLSGLSRETVDDILQNPTLIKQIEEQGINRDDLFNNVIKAIDSKDVELKATGKIYDTVRQSPNTFEVPSVDDIVEGAGIRITDKGLDFSKSRFAAAADVNAIKNIYDDIARAGTMNADELLNLRARVDSLINWKSGTNTPAQLLAKKMRAKVDDVAKKYIPGLAEVDAKYAPLKKFLSQRVRPLVYKSNGDLKDNAVSKIINLVNKGDDKTKLLEQIQPGLTQSIRAIRALEDVALAGGNKVGTYAQNILFASGGLVTGGVPGAVALGVLTNPHVVKNILIKYAQGRNLFKGAVDTITNKVLKGKPLNTKEAAIVSGALDDEVKRVKAERLQIPTRIEAQNRLPVGQSTSAPMTIPQTDKISASTARISSPAQSIPQEKPISPSVIKTPLDDNVSGKTMQAAQESSTKPVKSATIGDDISQTKMTAPKELIEEAKKYKTAEEFVNSKSYKGSSDKLYLIDDIEVEDEIGIIYRSLDKIDEEISSIQDNIYKNNYDKDIYDSFDDALTDMEQEIKNLEYLKKEFGEKALKLKDDAVEEWFSKNKEWLGENYDDVYSIVSNNKRNNGSAWEQLVQSSQEKEAIEYIRRMEISEGRHSNTNYDLITKKGMSEEDVSLLRREMNSGLEVDVSEKLENRHSELEALWKQAHNQSK